MRRREGIAQALQIFTGAMLVFSGTAKMSAPDPSLCLLVKEVFPAEWTLPATKVAGVLPGMEIVAGFGLALGIAIRLNLAVTSLLSLLFLGTLMLGALQGLNLETCGCFGRLDWGSTPPLVFGKAILLFVICCGMWLTLAPSRKSEHSLGAWEQ